MDWYLESGSSSVAACVELRMCQLELIVLRSEVYEVESVGLERVICAVVVFQRRLLKSLDLINKYWVVKLLKWYLKILNIRKLVIALDMW